MTEDKTPLLTEKERGAFAALNSMLTNARSLSASEWIPVNGTGSQRLADYRYNLEQLQKLFFESVVARFPNHSDFEFVQYNTDIVAIPNGTVEEKPLGIVVSGFPGVGKSHLATSSKWRVSDSDSSQFDKSEFPRNYVEEIAKRRTEYDIVLVSSHEEVRAELERQKIPYQIVHPGYECKEEYLQRYRDRGNSELFVTLLDKHWDHWIDGCLYDGSGDVNALRSVNGYRLGQGQFISDVVDRIVEFELSRRAR